jgi:hypothetical protein
VLGRRNICFVDEIVGSFGVMNLFLFLGGYHLFIILTKLYEIKYLENVILGGVIVLILVQDRIVILTIIKV